MRSSTGFLNLYKSLKIYLGVFVGPGNRGVGAQANRGWEAEEKRAGSRSSKKARIRREIQ